MTRPFAETMPFRYRVGQAEGISIAMTQSPTSSAWESPSVTAGGAAAASTLMSAISISGDFPMSFASRHRAVVKGTP